MTAAVATGLGAMVKRQIDAAAEMDVLSRQTGVAIEDLSAMEHVARETDVSFGTLESRLQRFNREIAEAAEEGDEAATSFGQLGVSLRDSRGEMRGSLDIFEDIADKVANAGSEFEQTAIATEFFGNRAGQELLPMLQKGSEGIEELRAEADRLGITIDEDMGRQAQQFQQNMRQVQNSLTGLTRNIAGDVLPATNDFIGVWQDMTGEVGDTSDIEDAEESMGGLEKTLRGLFAMTEMVRIGISNLSEAMVGLALTPAAVGADLGVRAGMRDALFELEQWPEERVRAIDSAISTFTGTSLTGILSGENEELQKELSFTEQHISNVFGNIEDNYEQGSKNLQRILDGVDASVSEALGTDDDDDDAGDQWSDAADAAEQEAQRMESAADQWRQRTEDEFTRHMMDLAELQSLYDQGLIDTITFERATDLVEEELAALDEQVDDHTQSMIDTADRWERETLSSFERYEEKLEDLREAHAEGFVDEDVFLEAVDMLQERFDPYGELAEDARMEELAEQARQVRADINGIDLATEAHLDSLKELLDEGKITYAEYQAAVEMATDAVEEAGEEVGHMTQFAEASLHELSDTFIDALVDPWEASLSEMGRQWLQTITQMALQAAAQDLIGGLFSDGGEVGVGGVPSFASGGAVSGPGTSTSDSIVARLSDGEYVQPADSVRHYGVGFMESIRQKTLPRFADGGLVGGSVGGASAGGGAITVQLVLDGRIIQQETVNAIRSGEGRRAVVEVAHQGGRRTP